MLRVFPQLLFVILLLNAKVNTRFNIPSKVEDNLSTAVRVLDLCPRLYIAVVFNIKTTAAAPGDITL